MIASQALHIFQQTLKKELKPNHFPSKKTPGFRFTSLRPVLSLLNKPHITQSSSSLGSTAPSTSWIYQKPPFFKKSSFIWQYGSHKPKAIDLHPSCSISARPLKDVPFLKWKFFLDQSPLFSDFLFKKTLSSFEHPLWIQIPPYTKTSIPLVFHHECSDQNTISFPFVIFEISPYCDLTIFEYFTGSKSDSKFPNASSFQKPSSKNSPSHMIGSSTVFWAHPQSRIRYGCFTHLPKKFFFFHREQINLFHSTSFKTCRFFENLRFSQVRSHVLLKESHARYQEKSASFLSKKNHFDFWSTMEHQASQTTTDFQYDTVTSDRAHQVFQGKIVIPHHADHTEAHQKNKNLLLSQKAQVEARPELEIGNENVVASHGSTVSSLDPEQLFYLQSRGIDDQNAKTLMISGFLQKAVQNMEFLLPVLKNASPIWSSFERESL